MTRDELKKKVNASALARQKVVAYDRSEEFFGCQVYLRTLSSADHGALNFSKFRTKVNRIDGGEYEIEMEPDMQGLSRQDAHLAVMGLSDENGQRLFSDAEVETVAAWTQELLDDVAAKIRLHNGMDKQAVADAKKNSDAASLNGSGSSLPDTSGQPSPNSVSA